MSNINDTAVPATVITASLKSIRDLKALLGPYLHPLTVAEREDLPKMGDKTLAFVEKMADFAQSLPQLMPAYLDVPALLIDANTARDLRMVSQELEALALDLDSTRMLAGSEGYTASLVGYAALKAAAAQSQPGAAAAVADLAPRFARPGKSGPKPPTPPTA